MLLRISSRVVWFTIQNTTSCSAEYSTSVIFNVNNLGSTASDVTVTLYNDAGNAISTPGRASGTTPGFALGTLYSIPGKQTIHYTAVFNASGGAACSDRPAYGKITIESDSGLLMANGQVTAYNTTNLYTYTSYSNVIINEGKPF